MILQQSHKKQSFRAVLAFVYAPEVQQLSLYLKCIVNIFPPCTSIFVSPFLRYVSITVPLFCGAKEMKIH